MSEAQSLLADIKRFAEKHRIAPSTFGKRAVNDGKLVARLESGNSVTLNKAAEIRAYMLSVETGGQNNSEVAA